MTFIFINNTIYSRYEDKKDVILEALGKTNRAGVASPRPRALSPLQKHQVAPVSSPPVVVQAPSSSKPVKPTRPDKLTIDIPPPEKVSTTLQGILSPTLERKGSMTKRGQPKGSDIPVQDRDSKKPPPRPTPRSATSDAAIDLAKLSPVKGMAP